MDVVKILYKNNLLCSKRTIFSVMMLIQLLLYFRGKNFVIKYEGSFKSGNSHCLVLEHVAHDRPEVII